MGKTNWEIAMILGTSVHNVKYHVAELLNKLDVVNRVHAVARARALGLLGERAPFVHSR
jgi:DNA-binding CsgD family transcriptional regulator